MNWKNSRWIRSSSKKRYSRKNRRRPENLMLVSKIWNLHYFPWLAQGFQVKECIVKEFYVKAVQTCPQDKVFKEVCQMLVEYCNAENT